ncbi:SAM-dependent methyltransferase [Kribbella sp. NPDC051587]|uniref:SAM-dependent methyltransferase n=1 Tax=Kribbella sp. NPDC051587 TaxID=3364119 RepID=UPI00378C2522
MPDESIPQGALRVGGVRLDQPATARLWNLAGGGKGHYGGDRGLYDEITKVTAVFPHLVASSRRFVVGAAEHLVAKLGITQYIDLGVGLPLDASSFYSSPGNLHKIVQSLTPSAKVVYVDQDPIVLANARGLLAENDRVLVADGDIFEPAELLPQLKQTAFLDWDKPIALFCTAVLHYHPGTAADVTATMQTYLDALPARSCTVITHFLDQEDPQYDAAVRQVEKVLTSSAIGAGWFRTKTDLEAMFPDQELVGAGVQPCHEWWPELKPAVTDSWIQDYIGGGIGRKRSGRR